MYRASAFWNSPSSCSRLARVPTAPPTYTSWTGSSAASARSSARSRCLAASWRRARALKARACPPLLVRRNPPGLYVRRTLLDQRLQDRRGLGEVVQRLLGFAGRPECVGQVDVEAAKRAGDVRVPGRIAKQRLQHFQALAESRRGLGPA